MSTWRGAYIYQRDRRLLAINAELMASRRPADGADPQELERRRDLDRRSTARRRAARKAKLGSQLLEHQT